MYIYIYLYNIDGIYISIFPTFLLGCAWSNALSFNFQGLLGATQDQALWCESSMGLTWGQ